MESDSHPIVVEPKVLTVSRSVTLKDAKNIFIASADATLPPFCSDDDPGTIWRVSFRGTIKGNGVLSVMIEVEVALRGSRKIRLNAIEVALKKADGSVLDSLEVAQNKVLSNGDNVTRGFDASQKSEKQIAMEIKIEYLKGVSTTWEHVEKVKAPSFNSDCELKYDMLKYLESEEDADVRFIVGDQTFRAHKQYFRSMFQSGMAESNGAPIVAVDASASCIQQLLRFMYGGVIPDVSSPDVAPLLVLADNPQRMLRLSHQEESEEDIESKNQEIQLA